MKALHSGPWMDDALRSSPGTDRTLAGYTFIPPPPLMVLTFLSRLNDP